MVELTQIPAVVNISTAVDDSFTSLIDLSISLSGYTATALVDHQDGTTAALSFDIVETDLSNGQVTISLTKTQITALGVGVHDWYFRYGNGTIERRALAGKFTVVEY